MDHRVDAFEGVADGGAVTDVADAKIDLGRQFGRPDPAGVDLLDQAVQHADGRSRVEQGLADMAPDEPRASGDKDPLAPHPT